MNEGEERLQAAIDAVTAIADKTEAAFTTNHSVDVQMRAVAYMIRAAITEALKGAHE